MNNDYHKQLLSQRDFLQKMLEKNTYNGCIGTHE